MTPQDLKNSIIQLAIQGRLVEQRSEDGTGEELYKHIQIEKKALIKTGKIKKGKSLPEITEDEIPFEIPETWKWVRWGDLSESIQYGYNAPAQESGRIRMVRISDIQNGRVLWETVPYCEISEQEIPTYLLASNDILFARTGGTVGKSYLVKDVPEEAIYAGYLIRTRYSSQLCPEYMKLFMDSQLYWIQLRSGTIATAQPNCNGKTLSKMILPLPPLAEQKRIVAKKEELQPLIDRYEQAWTKLENFNQRFPIDMQKSILQMAMQGKLVDQKTEEGTGEELYRNIQKAKRDLEKNGKIKKSKPESKIIEEEIPFELPETWKWCRLRDVCELIIDCPHSTPKYYEQELEHKAIDTNCIDADGNITGWRYVDETDYLNRIVRGEPQEGDIVYTREGSICRAAILPEGQKVCLGQRVMLIRKGDGILPSYLKMVLMAPQTVMALTAKQRGIGAKHVNVADVCNLIFPLPPSLEQGRIMEKLDQLLPKCRKLR